MLATILTAMPSKNTRLRREQMRAGGLTLDSRKIRVCQARLIGQSGTITVRLVRITSGGQTPLGGTSKTWITSYKMDHKTE